MRVEEHNMKNKQKNFKNNLNALGKKIQNGSPLRIFTTTNYQQNNLCGRSDSENFP